MKSLRTRLSGTSEVVLALLITTILSIMILPVPPQIVDWLVAINISASVWVLFVALFVQDAIQLPGMPTILLLATLFRLALNVTTTRLILGRAEAGDIIQGFGTFVVGGNFVVGAIVFVVLALIQFIVIAKGSERVAEVAARFTLDAMPGKQMSIDADLRNGLITDEQARLQRRMMARESKLYGNMDGAMKFVKGDAIAGIVISVVNIVGGLIIGQMDFGLSPGAAIRRFGILTIGDGLVSQIPALLISVAAGLVATRVASSDDDENQARVASDMVRQLTANPLASFAAGFFLLAMASTSSWTGFPWPPFLVLGAGALLAGESRRRARVDERRRAGSLSAVDEVEPDAGIGDEARGDFAPAPLLLELHGGFRSMLGYDGGNEERLEAWQTQLRKLREALSAELGFGVPAIQIGFTSKSLPERGYALYAFDGLLAKAQIPDGGSFAMAPFARVAEITDEVLRVRWPGTRLMVGLVHEDEALEAVKRAGIPIWTGEDALLHHLRLIVRRNAVELMTMQETSRMVDGLRNEHPNLVQAVVPTLFPIQDINEVLKGLLREQVPVRDLRRVLETLARLKIPAEQRSAAVVNELVRLEMRKALCSRFAVGRKRLDYYLLAPDIQDSLRDEAAGRPLSPDERDEIRAAIGRTVDPARHIGTYPVLLVPPELRLATFALVEGVLGDVAVLSTQEVSIEIVMNYIGTVSDETVPMDSLAKDPVETGA